MTAGSGERRRGPEHKLPVIGVLRLVWEVYKRRWPLLVPLALLVLLPQALADAAFGDLEVERISSVSDVFKLVMIPVTIGINFGGEALYAGLVAAGVQQWLRGLELRDIPHVLREIRLGRLVAIDILIVVGTVAGLILLVIPGIAFYTYFVISTALVELDDLRIRPAMKRSFELVRGSLFRVLGFIGLVVLLTDGTALLLEAPVHGLTGEAAFNLLIEAALEPFQGLTTVFLALALLEINGEDRRLKEFAERLPAPRAERTQSKRAASAERTPASRAAAQPGGARPVAD